MEKILEESGGKRRFCLIIEKDRFYDYEKRMLSESGCPHTLPMHFVREPDKIKAYYDFTGYLPLVDYITQKVSSASLERGNQTMLYDSLDVLSNLLEGLNGADNYLLFAARMKLGMEMVFIHPEDKKVVFSFLPEQGENQQVEKASLQNRIIGLTEEIQHFYGNSEVDQCYERFLGLIRSKNLGLDGMINVLGVLQREISYIYWNNSEFRKLDENSLPAENEGQTVNDKQDKLTKMLSRKRFNKEIPLKLFLLQIVIIIGLAAVYLSGILEAVDLAGFAVIAGGADLWLLRNLHYV